MGTSITRDMAAGVPYASLGVRVGNGSQGMLLLVDDTTGPLLWTAGRKVSIVTKRGRIVGTKGFGYDLGGLSLQRETPKGDGVETYWLADFPDLGRYSVPVVCVSNVADDETISILGQPLPTRRVVEDCHDAAADLSWSFQNTYWVDRQSGFVWRSLQYVHPKLPALETEIFRPPYSQR